MGLAGCSLDVFEGLGEKEFPGFDSLEKQAKVMASRPDESLDSGVSSTACDTDVKGSEDVNFAEMNSLDSKQNVGGDKVFTFKKVNRFKQATSEDELSLLSIKSFAETTDKKITWAINMFKEWRMHRLRVGPYDTTHGTLQWVNVDDSANLLKPHLCTALCCFLNETRREDGLEFPGKTLYEILMCIQFFLKGLFWKLIDDPEFVKLKFMLDNLMKNHCASRVGSEVCASMPLSYSDEDKIWASGVLGEDSPDKLRDTLMFLLGMHLALRGREEHQNLRCPPFDCQLSITKDSEGHKILLYREDARTKTNQGGLSGRKYVPKSVKIYPSDNFDRDPVRLFEKYVGLLPSEAKSSTLYKYALKSTRLSPVQWYADKPIGVNALKKTVKELTKQAGLVGHYTNHSLQSTAATRMYNQGLDEQVIKEVTGHKSDAVQAYKRMSDNLLKAASNVIGGKSEPKEFDIDSVKLEKPQEKDTVVPGGPGSRIHKLNCTNCKGDQCGQMCRFLQNLEVHRDRKVKKMWLSLKYKN